jgi:DNA-binding transcriptional LysR family regulator
VRLRHIEIFNAVISAGSISGAARLLGLTQPSVSRTLQHAELQLGIPLFHRSKGRLLPTPDALTLAPHIDRLFQQLDEVQRLAGNLKAGHGAQELRILASHTLSHYVIPKAVHVFRSRKAGVATRILSVQSAQLVAGLALQEADVGLLLSSFVHPALKNEPVAQGQMVCVARRSVAQALSRPASSIKLADLAAQPIIALAVSDPMGRLVHQACRDAGIQLQSEITVQNYHAALAFAHQGTGTAIVDSFTALSADLGVVSVRPLEPSIPVTLQAMHPRAKVSPESVATFLDCVREVLDESAPGSVLP